MLQGGPLFGSAPLELAVARAVALRMWTRISRSWHGSVWAARRRMSA